ncbi:hypothetical protein GCM10009577_77100 [Streptomyces javensis]
MLLSEVPTRNRPLPSTRTAISRISLCVGPRRPVALDTQGQTESGGVGQEVTARPLMVGEVRPDRGHRQNTGTRATGCKVAQRKRQLALPNERAARPIAFHVPALRGPDAVGELSEWLCTGLDGFSPARYGALRPSVL